MIHYIKINKYWIDIMLTELDQYKLYDNDN